jgi:hypothetical protein
VRFIYTDEAGTSAKEPVTVVIGLVVNPDTQLLPATSEVDKIFATVPPQCRKTFEFHATSIWGNKKYRDG